MVRDLKLLEESQSEIGISHHTQKELFEARVALTEFIAITSLCIHVSDHHIVHLKLIMCQ